MTRKTRELGAALLPIGLFVGVALTIFAPVLFGGKTLYPTDITNHLILPFSAERANQDVQETALSDYVLYYYPVRHFQASAFRAGDLNLWNPYIFGGQPAYANNASIVAFDPFNVLLILLDLAQALGWRSFLQVVACMMFMFLYLRHLQLGTPASLIGSIGYSLNSMFWVNAFDWSIAGMLWLPLVCLLTDRAVVTRSVRATALAALAMGTALLASPLQIYFYICVCVVAVQGLQWLVLSREWYQLRVTATICGLVLLAGIAMTAIQLLPSLELYAHSARFAGGPLQATGQSARSLPETAIATAGLASFVFPNLAGRAKGSMVISGVLWGGETHWQGFIGVLPAFLAVVGALASRDRRRIPFLILAAAVIVLVLYTPLGPILYERFFLLYIFAAATLAAFGCHALLSSAEDIGRARLARRLVGAFTAVVIVLLGGINVALVIAGDQIRDIVDAQVLSTLPTNYFGRSYPDLYVHKAHAFLDELKFSSPHTGIPLLVALAGIVLISQRLRGRLAARTFAGGALVVTVADLVFMTRTHVPLVDLARNPFTPESPAIQLVQDDADLHRVISYRGSSEPPVLPLGLASTYGLQSADGNDNLGPPNVFQLVSFDQQPCGHELCVTPSGTDLVDVKYLFVGPRTRLPAADFELIYDSEIRVYRDRRAPIGRAFWVSDYEVIADTTAAIARVASPWFNSRESVVLDRDPGVKRIGKQIAAKVDVTKYTPTRVRVQVDALAAGLVVLSDTFYPGWRATLDGESVPIYRANGVMRAVAVGAGQHRLSFDYQPVSLKLGAAISLASLCGVMGVVLFSGLPSRQEMVASSRV